MCSEYIEFVEHENQKVKDWVSKGNSFREIENYVVEIRPNIDGKIHFKVRNHIDFFSTDKGMTLNELEKRIINDIPYIKSIQFIEYSYSPIII